MDFPDVVDIGMGGGGRRMDLLVSFIGEHIGIEDSASDVVGPLALDDSAVLPGTSSLVITTDGHTVSPLFFRGGNIGSLAVAGTVNDLIVMGARPLYLTLSMVIEEGFPSSSLAEVCRTIGELCRRTGVRIVAGDTKVMPRGTVSGLVITTAGVGEMLREVPLQDSRASDGDVIIVSGTVGDHGASLMALREGIDLDTDLSSDVEPLWPALEHVVTHPAVHAMKDVTRGGLASALNEVATKSSCTLVLEEGEIPMREETQAICEILGLEPLEISSEGKVVLVVDGEQADEVMDLMRSSGLSPNQIGLVKQGGARVEVRTEIGGRRILSKPYGEPIPRVC